MTVSYVVTVYNKAPFLPAVLSAVAAEREQTGGEIVAVDDGSTDSSGTLLDQFAQQHKDVRILHQVNRGVAAATNTAIRASEQPFIRLIDGDDIVTSGSTMLLQQALETTGCGCAFGNWAAYEFGETQSGLPPAVPGAAARIVTDPLAEMIVRQMFVVSATLGRAEIYRKVLPLPEKYCIQDTSLGLKLATATTIARIGEICCYMALVAPGRIGENKARMFRDATLIARDLMGSWPIRYRAAAVRRNAGRAYHYARRHTVRPELRCSSLLAAKFLNYLPIPPLLPLWMNWIAGTYEAPLRGAGRLP